MTFYSEQSCNEEQVQTAVWRQKQQQKAAKVLFSVSFNAKRFAVEPQEASEGTSLYIYDIISMFLCSAETT